MLNASDLLGALLQGGGPRGRATGRLEHAMGDRGLGGAGGPLGQILGGLGGGTRAGTSSGGDILGGLAGMLGGSGGGRSGGRDLMVGGLGALAGALLAGRGRSGGSGGGIGGVTSGVLAGLPGGKMRGAIGAGGLAVLGMLAMKALRANQAASGAAAAPALEAELMPPEQAVAEGTALLVLRAMIEAAKADGRVDATERQRIVAKAQEGGVDGEAAAFLQQELERPADPDSLATGVRDPIIAAQVYAASLLAIQVDTPAEHMYLRSLAGKLGLEPAVVAQLHSALGVPPPA
jgi:uncharacterized membrane protein YebE (DUF533 family)